MMAPPRIYYRAYSAHTAHVYRCRRLLPCHAFFFLLSRPGDFTDGAPPCLMPQYGAPFESGARHACLLQRLCPPRNAFFAKSSIKRRAQHACREVRR